MHDHEQILLCLEIKRIQPWKTGHKNDGGGGDDGSNDYDLGISFSLFFNLSSCLLPFNVYKTLLYSIEEIDNFSAVSWLPILLFFNIFTRDFFFFLKEIVFVYRM